MRRWKKVALALVVLLLLAQAPFIYRRYRLARLDAAIQSLNAQRAPAPAADPFIDYSGVVHVHSLLGGHSTGRPEEIVAAARANGLAFVVMTEHPSAYLDTAAATLRGVHDGVLFIDGSELSARGDVRLLVVPGLAPPDTAAAGPPDAQETIARARRAGRLVFVAYPEQVSDWRLTDFDGLEVYNLYTNGKRLSYARLFLDGLWSFRRYPELLFASQFERPEANLKRWDELGARARVVGLAGNDAHANLGLSLRELTGKPLLELKLDPYESSFRLIRNHVLLPQGEPLTADSLLTALRQGHSFIACDLFCDAGGFRFTAETDSDRRLMGDEIPLPAAGGVRLVAATPVPSRLLLIRDGQTVGQARDATRAEFAATERGVYRIEAYLDQLGPPADVFPWIISNPIYVR